jgi:hypothetical protein
MTTRNQYVFISTKNKFSGDPWNFDIHFPTGFISARENETIKLSLVKLTLPLVIHQVNSTNNQLTFINASNQSTTVTIPNGTYTVYELIKVLQLNYPSLTSATFDKSRNNFVFTFANNHRITFNNKSNAIFGFSSNVTTPATTIQSNQPAKPNSIDSIVFNVYGVNPLFNNLDNLTGSMKLSHAISVLEIEDIPYGVLRYNNDSMEFAISTHDKEIKRLRFLMTDANGVTLDYANLPEFHFVMKIEYTTENDDVVGVLNEIKEFTRASYLHSAMTAFGNPDQ